MQGIKGKLSTVAVLTVLVVGTYVGFFTVVNRTMNAIAETAVAIDADRREEVRLRAVEDALRNTAGERVQLTSYFVREADIVAFIETIEGFGAVSGSEVTLISVDVVEEEAENSLPSLSIKFRALGSWAELYHLMTLVDTFPAALFVENTTLERVSGDLEDDPSWQLTARADAPLISNVE